MSESPTEFFEHAEHAEHVAASGERFLMKVSITIAILAVAAATVGSLETIETAASIGDKNEAVRIQNKTTDNWNFFQAKSIKKNMYDIAAASAAPGPVADGFKAQSKHNEDDGKELKVKGEELEHDVEAKLHDSETHERRHHILTVATTLLHISIAVATIAIIIRKHRWPYYSAIALGVLGVVGAAYAYI
ncbi:DUF4337 family protein [Beijerinckia sp. L45]|uniref:DUF4337 family protein n=1 Tax=Beijerinckia sp. L45 TaxID=1641855 RepID=UPI00131AEE58|nr:DUF4337 family protein [Beijerinckia sp. L45]